MEGKHWRGDGPAACPVGLLWAGCYPAMRSLYEAHPEIPQALRCDSVPSPEGAVPAGEKLS